MVKLRIKNKLSLVGYSACGLLGLLTLVMIAPVCTVGADAISNSTSDQQTRVAVNTAATVSVAMDDEVVIDVVPSGVGTFAQASTNVLVSTNNEEGYSMYLKTLDSTNSMTNTDIAKVGEKYEIAPLSDSDITSSQFSANTWGYALTDTVATPDTQYRAVPNTDQVVGGNQDVTGVDNYYLTFGAKVDTSLPAGQYANTVQISVVANPTVISNLSQLVYMQDMTSSICSNTKGADGLATITPGNEVEKRLIDSRDGKEYWVSKLADQNCWMVQNLALDITEDGLEKETTDIMEDWSETSVYPPHATNTGRNTDWLVASNHYTYSKNFGSTVAVIPLFKQKCVSPNNDSISLEMSDSQTIGEACADSGFLDVQEDWQATFEAQAGEWTMPDGERYSGLITANIEEKTYDAHYLVGNYYQYYAAVAGTIDEGTGIATGSICPKNWRLPVTGEIAGAYRNLFNQYGFENGLTGSETTVNGWNGKYDAMAKPLYNFHGGSVDAGYNALTGVGEQMYYTLVDGRNVLEQKAPKFAIFQESINQIESMVYYGTSVRCLAR